ncbi:ribosome maturation factor RimM [uncultured Devosia sp.]|uniref:ribosome maturation factor RimM n=1 Tax=uncultured Devosia sp. TaxID=211434 RepID=UPI0035C95B2F
MTNSNRLLMGMIGAAHGIKGEVRITPYTQDPEAIAAYGPLETDRPGLSVTIAHLRVQKTVVIARLKGVADRNAAEALNGVSLFIDRSRLPETEDDDDFYHADLIGLEARLEDGTVIGTVTALPNFGASDLIEIRNDVSGDTYLYPFTKGVVPTIHIEQGYLTIIVPTETEWGEEEEPD